MHIPDLANITAFCDPPVATPLGPTPASLATPLTLAIPPPSATSVRPPAPDGLPPFVKGITDFDTNFQSHTGKREAYLDSKGIDIEVKVYTFSYITTPRHVERSELAAPAVDCDVELAANTSLAKKWWIRNSKHFSVALDADFQDDAEGPLALYRCKFELHYYDQVLIDTETERQAHELPNPVIHEWVIIGLVMTI